MISYNAAISACEKGGQWEQAMQLLQQMVKQGITPNVISYNAAISACEKVGQCEHAIKLFGDMEKEGIKRDVITYNVAISACEKGRWETGELLMKVIVIKVLTKESRKEGLTLSPLRWTGHRCPW